MFDLSKIFNLSKKFTLPDTLLKLLYLQSLDTHDGDGWNNFFSRDL